jgi:hypothetical protein
MKAYLVSVVLICALVSLASHFLAATDSARYGRLALAVVLLWAVISPLLNLLSTVPELSLPADPPTEEGDMPLYAARAEEAFCEGICAAICEKFSLAKENVSVRAENFDLQTMRAKRICVLLKGKGILADSFAIAAFVEAEGLGDCEVELEIGSA